VSKWGWQNFMLIITIDITLTVIPLLKIVVEEVKEIYTIMKTNRRKRRENSMEGNSQQ
jgi:heme exporter protein D